MKKQTNRSINVFLILPFMVIALSMALAKLQAQINTYPVVHDMVVPSDQNKMYVELKGGDGGSNKGAQGGRGATVQGVLYIGTGNGMIAPGGILRFIPGKAGYTAHQKGGGGGGASAILYTPMHDANWYVIAVAAGGGGAHTYDDNYNIKYRNGGEGRANTDNLEEKPSYFLGYAGGGHKSGSADDCGGQAGMLNGEPVQASVGSGCSLKGGAGFGSGGSALPNPDYADRDLPPYWGGGGGGYYGGYSKGDGSSDEYENGGGSWANYSYFSSAAAHTNGTTSSSEDGYVSYSYDIGQIKFAYNTGKCIDDYGSNTSDGTNIQTYNCHSNSNQQWLIRTDDRTIRSMLDYQKCLDLSSSNTANGTNIQLWHCNGTNAQKWLYNGLYQTIHPGVNSDKCLDAANGSATTANVNVQLWDCMYSNNNQKWAIEGATTVSDPAKIKHIFPHSAPSYAVHSHTGAESGSNIQLWTKDDTNYAEQWYFDGLAIKMRDHQSLCIDLSSSNTSNGNNIQLYNCNGTNAQKWIYDGMTETIRSAINPDKCMQIEHNTDGVYGKRSNVEIWDCNGSAKQHFLIEE